MNYWLYLKQRDDWREGIDEGWLDYVSTAEMWQSISNKSDLELELELAIQQDYMAYRKMAVNDF